MRSWTIQAMIDQDNDMKIYDFEKPSIRRKMWINFTKKDFFGESLKIAWAEAKAAQKFKTATKNAPRRTLVAADKYIVGDMIHKNIITGLGVEFKPNSDMFSLGISPDTEYVQYADLS